MAEGLYAGNFLKDMHELSFQEKLMRFVHQNSLNEKARKNTLHISLNFAAEDQLSKEKLIEIAREYLEKIGFAAQPYLIYQHLDSGHKHLHVVTTTVQPNGRQIRTFNIGKIASEKARKELEISYGLTRAQGRKRQLKSQQGEAARIAHYGKTETKTAIQKVLQEVIPNYKYTSLGELNAVLGLYNVMADRCKETSRTYRYNGLYYRMLDEQGKKVGAPIKASAFAGNFTLSVLEEKFRQNLQLRSSYERSIKSAIDFEMRINVHTLATLKKALRKENINLVIRRNPEGRVYGLTYVDLKNKVVFNGSDLGKAYAAKGLTERLAQKIVEQVEAGMRQQHSRSLFNQGPNSKEEKLPLDREINADAFQKALDLVLKPEKQGEELNSHLIPKKRHRHSRGLHL
jgi:hypothetical protein